MICIQEIELNSIKFNNGGSMFNCNNCGEQFYFPERKREIHYECDEQPYEDFLACPYCKDGDIEEED